MALFETLYGKRCRTPLCWSKLDERHVVGPDLILEAEEKMKLISDKLKAAFDRQKSYANLKRCDIEFQVRDQMFFKVSPWKKVLRFKRKRKLSLRFIGPYEVIERIKPVLYRLRLPTKLERIHNVLHVSILKKYRSDPSHIILVEEIEVRPDLTYEEEPIEILSCDVKVLRNKTIPLEKVLWRNHKTKDATWETEDAMRHQYPYLFGSGNFDDKILFKGGELSHPKNRVSRNGH
ncbi:uncharacterized protein [Gossypium hirsutum]|uniref:Tf2-1-like SH3-like domain-containing protein n=1 Tax=Gossypium hirsutum TaxID=3635 RepID=A0A1U8IZI5_GOSHI|nr:uncharacterized protein LOC107900167 [Gossypium hirsutum]